MSKRCLMMARMEGRGLFLVVEGDNLIMMLHT